MSTRRAFFLRCGAALGAGAATAVGASSPTPDMPSSGDDELHRLRLFADREAIRRLHLAFTTQIEAQRYDAAARLFNAPVHLDQYRHHRAYRQRSDAITISDDRLHAAAMFHVDVEVCTPLQDDCTAAQMARLQGNVADHHWETGRLDAQYVKTRGEWKIASLTYRAIEG